MNVYKKLIIYFDISTVSVNFMAKLSGNKLTVRSYLHILKKFLLSVIFYQVFLSKKTKTNKNLFANRSF